MTRPMRRFDIDLVQEGRALIDLAKAAKWFVLSLGWNSAVESVASIEAGGTLRTSVLEDVRCLETFCEDTFLRYMCGHMSRHGQAVPVLRHYTTIATADAAYLGTRRYRAWYDPADVITRCQRHISNGRHEGVFSANRVWLDHLGKIRHRIVHGQKDAKRNFDLATNALAARVYPPLDLAGFFAIGTLPQHRG